MNVEAKLYTIFDSDPAPVLEFLCWLASRHTLPTPPRVLDVGCGPGRLLRPLAMRGWHVVGMEPNPAFREYAKQQADELDTVTVRAGGFNDIVGDEEFDLIIGVNSSFSHVLTPSERVDAFRRSLRALRNGGLLFLDLPNLLRVLMEYGGPRQFEAEMDGRPVTLVRHHEVDYHAATFTTKEQYTYIDTEGKKRQLLREHPYAIVSYPEIEYLLRETGFVSLETFTSYASREVERIGPGRMMIAAFKA